MNQDFIVSDLESQASAVAKYVQGWDEHRILSWLAERGTVVPVGKFVNGANQYLFTSNLGIRSIFFLTADRFTFIGDNTVWSPKIEF